MYSEHRNEQKAEYKTTHMKESQKRKITETVDGRDIVKSANTETYATMTDAEIINRLRSGEAQLMDYILEKYKQLVRSCARHLYLVGGDQEDLIQEGMLGLFKAVQTYNPEDPTPFEAYARLLINRQLYDAIAHSQRKKHAPLNSSLSMTEFEEDGAESELGTADSPETIVVDAENTKRLREQIEKVLSPLERQVFELYLEGSDYIQIAETLQKPAKSIDNALQRIRNKTRKLANTEH